MTRPTRKPPVKKPRRCSYCAELAAFRLGGPGPRVETFTCTSHLGRQTVEMLVEWPRVIVSVLRDEPRPSPPQQGRN